MIDILANRIYLVTQEKYRGHQRLLAWISKHENGLYLDIFTLLCGTHMSYHRDGKIWRTSHLQQPKRKMGFYYPLNDFQGIYQLGIMMIEKTQLFSNPPLRMRHIRNARAVYEIDLGSYPSKTLNAIIEMVESYELLSEISFNYPAPPKADSLTLDLIQPIIEITLLGHDHLLINPIDDGFNVSHYNNRFTANRKGITYYFETH